MARRRETVPPHFRA